MVNRAALDDFFVDFSFGDQLAMGRIFDRNYEVIVDFYLFFLHLSQCTKKCNPLQLNDFNTVAVGLNKAFLQIAIFQNRLFGSLFNHVQHGLGQRF